MTLPERSEKIISILLSLDIKNDDTLYNVKVRQYATFGIKYVWNETIYSYCPFKHKRKGNYTLANEKVTDSTLILVHHAYNFKNM